MKNLKKFIWLQLICMMFAMTVSVSAAELEVPTGASQFVTSSGQAAKKGWVTLSDGIKKRYYKNGQYLTGMRLVGGKIYYFNTNGVMQKGWKTINSKRYYFGTNGVRYTGLKVINKKCYYFSEKGVMKTGTVKVGNTTYYLNDNGTLEVKKINSTYYYPSGKVMGEVRKNDFITLQRAKDIVAQITNSNMSKSQKLQRCFDWVISKYYVTRRSFNKQEGWPAMFANDHFLGGGGDCFSDACAFAYLAKAVGYTNVNVCVDSNRGQGIGHCWAEVDGLVYDPLFAEAKSYSGNYGVPYGTYILYPEMRVAI